MALGGDLRNINLADIFQTLSMNRQVGTLVVRNGVKEKRIAFSQGGVSLASGRTIPGFRIGKYLVGTGRVSEEELQLALDEQRRHGALLGQILVDLGYCSHEDIEAVIRYHAAEELYEIFSWDRGEFQFHEGEQTESSSVATPYATTDFDPGGLVMEAARRIDEWERVRESIPSDRDFLLRTGVEGDFLNTDEWDEDLAGVYRLVDGTRDVGEILNEYHLSVFDTGMLLRELVLNGLIRAADFAELTSLAWGLIDSGEDERAGRLLEQSHLLDPGDITVLQHLTECYERLDEKRAAARCLVKIGIRLMETEQIPAAVDALEKAEKYDPGSEEPPCLLIKAYMAIDDTVAVANKARSAASILCEKGRFEQAIELCSAGLIGAGDDVALRITLANAYIGVGQKEQALDEFESVATYLEEKRNYRKLEEIYKKILQLDSSRKEYLRHLQELKEGAIRRRRMAVLGVGGGIASAVLLLLLVLAVTGGMSPQERLEQARQLFEQGEVDEARAIAEEIAADEGDTDVGTAANVFLATIERGGETTPEADKGAMGELKRKYRSFCDPAAEDMHQGRYAEGLKRLDEFSVYLKTEEHQELCRRAGNKAEKLLKEHTDEAKSLLGRYLEHLKKTLQTARNDLGTLSDTKIGEASYENVIKMMDLAGEVRQRILPGPLADNAHLLQVVELGLGKGATNISNAVGGVTDELGNLHDRADHFYHKARAIIRRREIKEADEATRSRMDEFLDDGDLEAALELGRKFLEQCAELRAERPDDCYGPVVHELLGEAGLNLDGLIAEKVDSIEKIVATMEHGEELVKEGRYEDANALFREIVERNYKIDFHDLIGLVLHLQTRPRHAEVKVETQMRGSEDMEVRLMDTVPADGLVIRYPPYGKAVVTVSMPSFETATISIKDFHDRHQAAETVHLVKQSSWHRTGTGPMESPPRLVAKRLYAPARDGHLRILDALNGELLEDHDTGMLGGFESPPLLVDGLVYLASLDRKLLAVRPDSGKLVWSFDTKAALSTAPVACADLIVVADKDGIAYGVRDGEQVWRQELDGRVQGDPVPMGDSVFFGTTEGIVYRLDGRTGDTLWQVKAGGRVYASLTLLGESRLIVGTDAPSLVCLSPKDGARQWSAPADNAIRGTPVEWDGRIFFTTLGGSLYAVSAEDGRQVARFQASAEPAPFESGPAIGEKGIYLVDSDGLLICYTLADEMRWSFSLGGRAVAAPVVAGGSIFVATESGDIFCFRE